MKNLKIKILSWLLHHANRQGKNEFFYKIKNQILAKHGRLIGYDIQFIEGKKCWSCGGTGIYVNYYDEEEGCWHCFNGWYKRPVWVILALYQFGKYKFHQPKERVYVKPETAMPVISGYIEHSRSKYGPLAVFVLCLIYENGFIRRWWKGVGNGWRIYWWKPSNWVNNIIHLLKKGKRAVPVQDIIRKIKIKQYRKKLGVEHYMTFDDELPF